MIVTAHEKGHPATPGFVATHGLPALSLQGHEVHVDGEQDLSRSHWCIDDRDRHHPHAIRRRPRDIDHVGAMDDRKRQQPIADRQWQLMRKTMEHAVLVYLAVALVAYPFLFLIYELWRHPPRSPFEDR